MTLKLGMHCTIIYYEKILGVALSFLSGVCCALLIRIYRTIFLTTNGRDGSEIF